MLHGILIGVLVVTVIIMWLRKDLFNMSVFDKAVFWVCLVIIIVLLMTVIVFVASAAENSAPAENSVVVEKPATTLCPTEFNPDEFAWVMVNIMSSEKEIAKDMMAIERIRVFRHLWISKCAARMFSYGSIGDADGKRVWAAIESPENIIAFLLTEKGWESGGNINFFVTDCAETGCNLTFALYRNKELVASRTLQIRQAPIFHFREPVE